MLTEKDLISLNRQFSSGIVRNKSSMEFALSQIHRSKYWFKSMCLLARAITIDHIFEDGNKRTAASVIMAYLDMNNYDYNPDKVAEVVLAIAKKSIKDINKIGGMIKNAIR
ncbi:MAG: hypothetical protein PHO02_00535 [Candidatus Nanoarchaeia archaeon]|nr:hypothetical protein [Candidatus Nanoarchaeia archaeon]